MELHWTGAAASDLIRLYSFLSATNEPAAARVVQSLTGAPELLLSNPRIGEQLFQFEPDEVRRLLVRDYEIRYQIRAQSIYILRLWHTREQRR